MVSFTDLRDAKLTELSDAAATWKRFVGVLESSSERYRTDFLGAVRESGWNGDAFHEAMRELTPTQQKIEAAVIEASGVAAVLDAAHRDFKDAQDRLNAALGEATEHGLTVRDDGSVHLPASSGAEQLDIDDRNDQARLRGWKDDIAGRLNRAVADATDADGRVASVLRKLSNDQFDLDAAAADVRDAATLAHIDASKIPTGDPRQAAAWWRGLSEQERQLYISMFPDKIGWLDGLPAGARDEANRIRLDGRIADLRSRQPPSQFDTAELNRLLHLRSRIGDLETNGQDIYLLGIDSAALGPDNVQEDDDGKSFVEDPIGKVVIAIGNPDTAGHTAVFVPGTGDNMNKLDDSLNRTEHLWQASDGYAPGRVSTVMWLGYDTPLTIPQAAAGGYATDGAPPLTHFVDGTHAARDAAGSGAGHLTVVGHSYGSTVIGVAAQNGLHADDIVVAGSPGMHAGDAADLGIDRRHVWAEGAVGDQVPVFGALFHGGPSGLPSDVDMPVVPSDAMFGGNVMTTDTQGHSPYYDLGTESLNNQARVVTGRYGEVRLESGSPPG